MYKIKLVYKLNTKKKLWLIYCKYSLEYGQMFSRSTLVSGYYGVALIPLKSTINKYGLYANFIKGGKFICKPLEYQHQCLNVNGENICGEYYTYIGYIYNNIFPYNKIAQMDAVAAATTLPPPKQEGGRKNIKTTTKNRKSRKLKKYNKNRKTKRKNKKSRK